MATPTTASEAFSLPARDLDLPMRFADLEIGRIAYVEAGAGTPLLLVHGFGDDMFTWRYQLRALAPVCRVIALDLPGFGHSDKPRIDYTPGVFVETLCAFLDHMEVDKAMLVGSSMGGAAALGLAVRHSQRVDRLALISPTTPGVIPAGRVFDVFFRLVRWPWLALRLVRHPSRWLVRAGLRGIVAEGTAIDDATVEHYLSIMRQEGFAYACVSTALHWREWSRFRPRMAEIAQPTLLLWGEHDRVHPMRQSGLLRTLVPQARFVTLPCGHLPQVERPDEVNAELERLLGEGSVPTHN